MGRPIRVVAEAWNTYWFRPAPLVDLAVVRIVAVGLQLGLLLRQGTAGLYDLSLLPDALFRSRATLKLMVWPLGWDFRPPFEMLEFAWFVTVVAGVLALIGLLTNLSLAVFAAGNVFLQAYVYAFGDIHHPEAVMMIALSALALSPSGHVLSVDALWRRKRTMGGDASSAAGRLLDRTSVFAGWPLLLLQWFFALMYLSAVISKMSHGGIAWMNGYTLQYELLRDGLRYDSPLALWLGQFHYLTLVLQCVVILFQSTFSLAVIFPRLRWIYVPLGLGFHIAILLTLRAPFLQWIALYAVFIPWSRVFKFVAARYARWQDHRRVPT